ncbi:head-tail connector protein [Paludisphaera rhizosphaerae]|uniref:head-tail connector protein n=1 Tax=Paludisphaera rhizosphaerae TaxID=2711216 RepID=UPI0013EDECEF|nr:head-tail connector protein [Paludisphaera rhizosphaerae]
MTYQTIVLEQPAELPVTLTEVKTHVRMPLDLDDDDALIMSYVASATKYVERRCAQRFVTQTLRTTFEGWTPRIKSVYLPWAPVASVVRMANVVDGSEVDVDLDAYGVTLGVPGAIARRVFGCVPVDAVVVDYVVGYGLAASVPAEVKLPVMILAGHWYARREPVITGTIVSECPMHVNDLIGGLRWGAYPA